MIEAVESTRELAVRRNVTIPQMIAGGTVLIPADPVQTQKDRVGLGKYFSGFEIRGVPYIEQAHLLTLQGKRVIIASNHINELDIIARRMALEAYGFTKFINDAAYPCELEWFEDPRKAQWMGADTVARVVTAHELKAAQEAKAQAAPGSEDEALFATYIENSRSLNKCAEEELAKHNPWAIYPESDFQRIGWVIRAPKEVSGFFPRTGEVYILPILTIGQEDLPVMIEDADIDSAQPVKITSIAGEIYPVNVVWKNRPAGTSPVDIVMASVVRLDPTFHSEYPRYIHPDLVDFYRQIDREVGHLFRYDVAA